jgi:transcription antitermination factor NusG
MLSTSHLPAASERAAILASQPHFPAEAAGERTWYAAFTMPQSERSVARHLDAYHVETFLPVFEETHTWKNRQKKKIARPLFPSYVFVCVSKSERRLVYRAPGLVRLVGNAAGPIPVQSSEIEFLRSAALLSHLEPFTDLIVGERVRIASGPMQGMEGTLVRKKNDLRFVLSVSLIHQHAALEVSAEDIEPIGR